MAATKCPKCGGSGQIWTSYSNLLGGGLNGFTPNLTNQGYQTTCNACEGVGVIRDPAPIIHVHVHVYQSDAVGDLSAALRKQIHEALAETDL